MEVQTMTLNSGTIDVYGRFIEEMDALRVDANASAVEVVGLCFRAVKRAQMVADGELATVAARSIPQLREPITVTLLDGSEVTV